MGGGFIPADSSNLRLNHFVVIGLVSMAYDVHPAQVEGLARELGYVPFDVEAKSDSATDEMLAKLPQEQLKLEQQRMIQVLLAERFNLKAHWEDREGKIYDLVVAKPGKLRFTSEPPSPDELKALGGRPVTPIFMRGSPSRGFELFGHGASTTDIAGILSARFGCPVIDKTKLSGKFDFDLKYYQTHDSDRNNGETNPWPPLETAIRDELGLKLLPSHGPIHVLVIDHIDRPSPN